MKFRVRQTLLKTMNEPPDLPPNVVNHYEDPYHFGQCENATHSAEVVGGCGDVGKCGDTVVVALRVSEGRVEEAWFDGEGCRVSQAAASILMEFIEGKSVSQIKQLPDKEMLRMIGADMPKTHHDCGLLALQAARGSFQAHDELQDEPQGATFTGPDLGDEC